jgi:flagellar protein FlaG
MNVNNINQVSSHPNRSETVVENGKKGRVESQEISNSSQNTVKVSRSELEDALEKANKIGQLLDRRLSFDIDEETNKVIVSVIDDNTGEIVRQIPPEEMLRIASHLKQLQVLNDRVIGAAKSIILSLRC